jgi:hypothetical protein
VTSAAEDLRKGKDIQERGKRWERERDRERKRKETISF